MFPLHGSEKGSIPLSPTKEFKMHYEVITPYFTRYGNPWDLEPPEYTCDWVCVEADTKRQAKVQAVREMRAQRMKWASYQYSDGASPFTGLKVFSLECPHGHCACTFKDCPKGFDALGDCKICYEETVGEPYPD